MGVDAYLAGIRRSVERALGDRLVGVWLVGSAALGDFDAARSDLDVQAVATEAPPRVELRALAAELEEAARDCPARGLEFVLYPRDGLADPDGPAVALNLNAGPRMARHVSYDPGADPRFWFTLDVSIARQAAIRLAGPPAAEVLPVLPRALVAAAAAEALDWHAAGDATGVATVLGACRTLAWARDGRWRSKRDAVAAARATLPDPAVADRALALRAGTPAEPLAPAEVAVAVAAARGALGALGAPRRD